MRRPISLLVVILALQVGLAGLLAARRNPLAAVSPQTALITAPLDQVDHITIEGQPAAGAAASSARVQLVKQADHWILPEYFNAPVDKFRLSSVLSELTSLKRGLPIATSSDALKRFKLEDGNFERKVTLRQGSKVLSTLYFGSSAGAHKTDARTSADRAVYDVDLAAYELPTSSSEWLDEDVLQRDPASLTELQIDSTMAHGLKLMRTPAAPAAPGSATAAAAAAATAPAPAAASKPWTLDPQPPAGRQLDATRADSLAREISELHVEGILGTTPQPQWQPDHPPLTLQLRDDKLPGQLVTWTLYAPVIPAPATPPKAAAKAAAGAAATARAPIKPAEPYYVLKDSTQPWYFRVSAVSGKQLLDDSSSEQLVTAINAPGKGAAHPSTQVSAARPHRAGRAKGTGGTTPGAGT